MAARPARVPLHHHPDHFGAAIIHAGMLNPTRLAVDTNGANQYAEFGDPNTAQGFQQLQAVDAYVGTSLNQEAAGRADDYTFVEMTLGSAQQHAQK